MDEEPEAVMLPPPIFDPRTLMPMSHLVNAGSNPDLIRIDEKKVTAFYSFLVRGLVCRLFDGTIQPSANEVRIYLADKATILATLGDTFAGARKYRFDQGPGFRGEYVYSKSGVRFVAFFAVLIWQRHYFHSAVRVESGSEILGERSR